MGSFLKTHNSIVSVMRFVVVESSPQRLRSFGLKAEVEVTCTVVTCTKKIRDRSLFFYYYPNGLLTHMKPLFRCKSGRMEFGRANQTYAVV